MKKLTKPAGDEGAEKLLILEKMFVPFVLIWLKEAAQKLSNYVDNAFRMDKVGILDIQTLLFGGKFFGNFREEFSRKNH